MRRFDVRYMLAEIIQRKNRSVLVLSVIALGIVFCICLNALAGAYEQAASVPLKEIGADLTVQKSGGPIPEKFEGAVLPCATDAIKGSAVKTVSGLPGVEEVAPALLLWVFDSGQKDSSDFKMVLGIDPTSNVGPGKLKSAVKDGRFLSSGDRDMAVVDESYAASKRLKAGDILTMAGRSFHIVGVVVTPAASLVGTTNVYISLTDADEIAARSPNVLGFKKGDINVLFVKADPSRITSVQSGISKSIKGVTVSTPTSFLVLMGGLAAAVRRLSLIGTFIAFTAALAMTIRTSASNIWERRRDIAIMKAVGWSNHDVRRQLLSENLVLGLVGGLVGLAASFAFILALSGQSTTIPLPWELDPYPHFYLTTSAAKSLTVPLDFHLSWLSALLAVVSGVAIALITTLMVIVRLAHIKPAEVLRYE